MSASPAEPSGKRRSAWITSIADLWVIISACLILIALALPNLRLVAAHCRVIVAIGEVREISRAIDRHRLLHGLRYPPSLIDVGQAGRLDPWGNPYEYHLHARKSAQPKRTDREQAALNTDYDLFSMGPDGKSRAALTAKFSRDDIVRGANGMFFDVAAEY